MADLARSSDDPLSNDKVDQLTQNAEHARGDLVASALNGMPLYQVTAIIKDMQSVNGDHLMEGKTFNKIGTFRRGEDEFSLTVREDGRDVVPSDIAKVDSTVRSHVIASGRDHEAELPPHDILPHDQTAAITRDLEHGHGRSFAEATLGKSDEQQCGIIYDIMLQNKQDLYSHLTHSALIPGMGTRPVKVYTQDNELLSSSDGTKTEYHDVPLPSNNLSGAEIASLTSDAQRGVGDTVLTALGDRPFKEARSILDAILDQNMLNRNLDPSVAKLSAGSFTAMNGNREYKLSIHDTSIVTIRDSYSFGFPLRFSSNY